MRGVGKPKIYFFFRRVVLINERVVMKKSERTATCLISCGNKFIRYAAFFKKKSSTQFHSITQLS